jgi:hypothetical protein
MNLSFLSRREDERETIKAKEMVNIVLESTVLDIPGPHVMTPEEEEAEFRRDMREISGMVRSARGEPLDNDTAITQLTDVKNLMERSRFPTYPLLGKQVVLRLMASTFPEAKAALEWADDEAHALIGYKGQARTESVEMNKSQANQPAQQFYLGSEKRAEIAEQPKRHFWSRGTKKEADELEGQQ